MRWHLIHTKPRQEHRAILNLEQQGFACYLPMLPVQTLRRGELQVREEPLFARYLFIQLDSSQSGHNWAPIRSTKGVSRIVSFGNQPATVSDTLIQTLREQSALHQEHPRNLFTPGERLTITEGPFKGIESVFQMEDAEQRALVLIEFLSKPLVRSMPYAHLRKP